jgi:hypothetical protein
MAISMTNIITTLRWLTALYLATCAWAAVAQNIVDNPDWVEEAVTEAPTFSLNRLIAIEMPPYVSLKVGVDPATIMVGNDGVVRYVVVMTNATGSVNAVYEGIRCVTSEVKTYARQMTGGQWTKVASPQWTAVNDNMPSRHAYAIARQGACDARSAPGRRAIIDALKNGKKD